MSLEGLIIIAVKIGSTVIRLSFSCSIRNSILRLCHILFLFHRLLRTEVKMLN